MAPTEPEDNSRNILSTMQSLLALDMYKISLKEREEVFEDLHGVSGLIDESPELVASRLAELESEIAKIRCRDAYVAATSKDSSYTSSRALRLKFLRAETFDSKRAAARLVGFFERKLEAFGPDPLARDILISDLNEEDQICLQSGLMTLVPEKDMAGRGIMTWMPTLTGGGFSVGAKMRCLLYIFSAAAEDEDAQKKGIVWVGRATPRCGRILLDDPSSWKLPKLAAVFPVRIHAFHISSERNSLPAKLCQTFPAMWSALGRHIRVRSRCYTGGLVEVFYQLNSFGIPTRSLPLDMMGKFHLENHAEWYRNRQAIEAAPHGNARQGHTLRLQTTPYLEPRVLVNETERISELSVGNITSINERRGSSPTEAKREVDRQHHHDSISRFENNEAANLEAKEKQITSSDETNKDGCIAVPRPMIDVLMGKVSQAHAGNTRYQSLIAEYQESYDACETRIEKTVVTYAIVMKVKEYGGRFLLRQKGSTNWYVAAESVVSEKVTNAFRGRRKTARSRVVKRSNDGTPKTASKRRLQELKHDDPQLVRVEQ